MTAVDTRALARKAKAASEIRQALMAGATPHPGPYAADYVEVRNWHGAVIASVSSGALGDNRTVYATAALLAASWELAARLEALVAAVVASRRPEATEEETEELRHQLRLARELGDRLPPLRAPAAGEVSS
ncbi:hypothetical protein [Methylobrevis pamukkalensis]|uniref:Uncharacterized protein n=1 Tax=Methylobrevis pamukkalensis TaxID=1439726 RepID=A0A1E3H4G2_9HYPH|nr:hypothetical protein [Methylobrevis pamukkalensis]ODN71202.1 hypothetical protein A6302_01491 [Methylobrevis pamukkalensis]